MSFLSAFGLAVRPLVRRPMRTFLLLQGTIWGVAVALFPSAVIEGTRHATLTRGAALGADRIAVAPDPTAPAGGDLKPDDVARLREALGRDGIDVLALGGLRVLRLLGGEGGEDGALVEADPETPRARGLDLAEGRWLRADDGPDACVLEAGAAVRFGGPGVHAGDTVGVDGRTLRVVGITTRQDATRRATNDLGFDVTHPMYAKLGRMLLLALGIPRLEDAWKRSDGVVYVPLAGDASLDWIHLRAPPSDVKRAAARSSETLLARGRAALVLHPLVLPLVLGKEIDRFEAVRTALFLACLVMGAVVMANLGLLTVLHRGHEIAVRRVEGATRGRIATQFLLEGLALTAVGCVLGGVLAMGLAALRVAVEPVTGFDWIFPWRDAWLVVAVALFIGCAASLLPAWRASRLQPVEGLAEEGR